MAPVRQGSPAPLAGQFEPNAKEEHRYQNRGRNVVGRGEPDVFRNATPPAEVDDALVTDRVHRRPW